MKEASWRDVITDYVEIGKHLANIEICFRDIWVSEARGVKNPEIYLDDALRIARKLVRALETLAFNVRANKGED